MTNAGKWPEWAELYRGRADLGPLSVRELKQKTGLGERKARALQALLRDPAPTPAPAHSEDERTGQVEYVALTDEYIYDLPRRARPLILSGDAVRALRRDYSNWKGSAATINEVARSRGLPRRDLVAILRIHGVTHDEMPFTDEELAERPDEDLHDDLIAMRKLALSTTAQREEWRALRADALRWRRLQDAVIEPMARAAEALGAKYTPPPSPGLYAPGKARKGLLVLSPTDLHFGKAGWVGFGAGAYSREECSRRVRVAVQNVLTRLPFVPERILVPIGSDWFHIDNAAGGTTRGTPQDMDGVPEQIWEEGSALALDVLSLLRDIAPLDLVLQAGNHDQMLSACLFTVVRSYFRSDNGVRFLGDRGPYQFHAYGRSLIGITHGDGLKSAKDLGPLMAVHAAVDWGKSADGQRYWLTGNLHHYSTHEEAGVTVFLLPSLAGSDRWHTRKGYTTSRPALHGLLFDPDEGFIGTVSAAVG